MTSALLDTADDPKIHLLLHTSVHSPETTTLLLSGLKKPRYYRFG